MDRSFFVLGLREDATPQQVKTAYEHRLKKYKAGDYTDDPEYAARKIAELKEAYDRAYQLAGGTATEELHVPTRPKPAAPRTNFHRDREQRERFDREFTDKRKKKRKSKKAKADDENLTTKKTAASVVALVITLVSTVLPLVFDAFDDSDYHYAEPSRDYAAAEEWEIYDAGQKANDFMGEHFQTCSYGEFEQDTDREMKPSVDAFIQTYTDWETIEEATEYLSSTYPEYQTDAEADILTQITCFLDFYEIWSYDSAIGFKSPYGRQQILTVSDYMHFLNDFYRHELKDDVQE